MSTTESGREPGDRTPVFVDASGRRRRGVLVLGYLGASAATAYLAAFGLTLGTTTVALQPVGATLVPTPSAPDDEGDEGAPEEPEIEPAAAQAVTVATHHAAPHSERASTHHTRAERPHHVVAPRAEPVRRVELRVVRAPQRVVTTTHTTVVTREIPRATTHHHQHRTHTTHRHTTVHGTPTHGSSGSTDAATADVLHTGHTSTSTQA
ncbi:hypothetical protein [Actinomycetospora flava]|uniref:Uncharacterized protein n=1 Tax=Actinomycetospora flava TaxID=3129232 RepID=A0ABU8M7L1_9PSEU